ncbi:MAG: NAD(P)H-dependent oxidoreductase [Halobacteriaceae archaeon]
MFDLPAELTARDDPVRVGVVGAGLFGSNLVTQTERVPGLRVAAIADIDRSKADEAFARAGVDPEGVAHVDGRAAADDRFDAGGRAVLGDGLELARADVDVLVEATGVPEVGARHAYAAVTAGTHVVMVNVEADTVVGPTLATLAEANGVTYSLAYGDQPSLIVELVDWARLAGFEVVAAGKGVAFRESYHHGTPDDVFDRVGLSPAVVADRDLNPRMYNSFLDGTKIAVEMCAVANATGLDVDVSGMHLPTAEIPEIPSLLSPDGLLDSTGVVDSISTLHEDGTPVHEDRDLGLGVFVVVRSPDGHVQDYLREYAGPGHKVAADGEYALFYRPHHLPGLETTVSVAQAAVHGRSTGAPRERRAEVVGAAKDDLDAGTELDGGGGYTVYGHLVSAGTADAEGYVPFELLDGAELERDVAEDEVVTYDDVALDTDSFLYSLRRVQEGAA